MKKSTLKRALAGLAIVGIVGCLAVVCVSKEAQASPPPAIVSISVCSPTGAGDPGSCPSGTFDSRQVVLGPSGVPLNQYDVGGVTDEHASVLPPGSLQGNSDYLFFVAAGTDVHPHNIGVVVLSGGSGPDANGQWTLNFAPGYGSYSEGYGQVFVAPIDQIQCPAVADGNPAHQDQTFDLNYAAAGSVVPDPTSSPGALLMIYEGCNACIGSAGGHRTGEGAYISVGVATSVDYGRTWPTYRGTPTFDFVPLPDSSHTQGPSAPFGALGQSVCMGNDCTTTPPVSYGRYTVLTPPVSLAWLVESGHSAMDAAHDAEPAAFVDDIGSGSDSYVYEIHIHNPGDAAGPGEQFPDGRDHDLTMSRARLNGGTAPLQFLKWDGQSFSEPGIGGHEVQILPDGAFENCGDLDQKRSQGSISYVKDTQQYLLTFTCNSRGDPASGTPGGPWGSAWFYATTDDLSHQRWSTPQEIIGSWMTYETGTKEVPYGCQSYMGWYPTFMSLNHKPGHLGLRGYVFSMYGCLTGGDNPPTRQYVSHAFTITTGPPPCAYTISPTNRTFNANGGSLSINVSATGQTDCPAPPVVEDAEWISVSGTPTWKANKGTVKIAVQKNLSSQSKTGVVSIGGEDLTIEQDGAICQLTALKPSSGKYPNTGGSGSFDITVSPQDCGWNVATTSDWIHLDTTTGTGTGTATFHMDANGSGKNRTGKINVSLVQNPTKKKTFTVNESK